MGLPADPHYLDLTAAAQRLGLRECDIADMAHRGELPAVRVGCDELRIPRVAVENQRLALSSRADLVLRSPEPPAGPRRQTVKQRERSFIRLTGLNPCQYLNAFADGGLDAPDEHVAEFVIEAEELVAAARRR